VIRTIGWRHRDHVGGVTGLLTGSFEQLATAGYLIQE
jgi:hypothetical protein